MLAEADAPGTLHYLIEAEGFRVAGCAADEIELRRVLEQDLQPEVIVLDSDISATALLVARELSPSSHVIVIWPDGVQVPSAADRIAPSLVYEQLGPAIRRAAVERWLSDHSTDVPSEELRPKAGGPTVSAEAVSEPGLGRTASRLSVMSIVLIAAIVLTMGASFALDGWHAPPQHAAPPPKSSAPQPTATHSNPGIAPTAPPNRDVRSPEFLPCPPAGRSDGGAPNAHAAGSLRAADDPSCRRLKGSKSRPTHPGPDDHAHGTPSAAGGKGNHGAAQGDPGEAADAHRSGAHGQSDGHSASPSGSGRGPKN